MKKLNITYDTAEIENGEKIVGEILQGRRFVDGSIKHYELVKEG